MRCAALHCTAMLCDAMRCRRDGPIRLIEAGGLGWAATIGLDCS